jgi:type I restriction enzyme S subunit
MAPIGSTLLLVRGSALHNEILSGLVTESVCFNQDVKALVPNSQIAPKFLTFVMHGRAPDLLKMVSSAGNTAGVLDTKLLKSFGILLPPLPEQRAIATALSDVDGLLGALDRLIAKKRDLKQAAMQQLLTGQTRLPGFKGEWVVKTLGDFGVCLRGVSYRGDSDLSSYDTPDTKRLLRSNNVQNATVVTTDIQFVNSLRVSAHQILKENDILVCMANGSKALVGKAGLFTKNDGYDYTFGAFMGCYRTDSAVANPSFVFYLFHTGRYRNYINNLLAGSSINNLSPGSIHSLEFFMPPLPEQTAIASVLSGMDAELVALEKRREKTRALKQGMMQELLTGRTRLV